MKKTLLISAMVTLGWINNSYAYEMPFIPDAPPLVHQKSAATSIPKKINFAQHLKNQVLDLSYSKLEDKDMPPIIEFVKAHPQITSLNLAGNSQLTGSGLVPLAAITSLKELNLERTYKDCKVENGQTICWGGLEGKDIFPFANNQNLTKLNLSWHTIGDEGAVVLAKNRLLTELDVSNNDITDIGGIALAQNKNLQVLSLWANHHVGTPTAQAFTNNTTLKKLDVHQTAMDDSAAAIALAKNTTLTELDLGVNYIYDEGAMALAQNRTLKKLKVWDSKIEKAGIVALSKNKILTSLYFSRDDWVSPEQLSKPIGDEGAAAFANNTTLKRLTLGYSDISAAGVAELVKNKNLKELGLFENPKIGDAGAQIIAQQAQQLECVNLSDCKLTDQSAQALAGLPHLNTAWLFGNFIGDTGAAALEEDMTLRELDLSYNEIYDKGAIALAQTKTLNFLDVTLNHLTDIGYRALENNKFIKDLYIGGDELHASSNDSIPKILSMRDIKRHVAVSGQDFCYRSSNAMQCIRGNKQPKVE